MENTLVLTFLFLFHFCPGGTYETYCSSGERLHTPREGHDVCLPCPHGTFIAEEHHFFGECKPCTGIENPEVEVFACPCDGSHDAVILCTGGFYRRRARDVQHTEMCEKCTECQFPARPCEGYYDTVCCPPNNDAVMTPAGVFVCKEKPNLCGAGQFFRTSNKECLPCPAGTFMSDHSHTYKDCLKCEELSENNLTQAFITRPCSRTAPTLFGCKAGYFRDPTQESLQIEVPCTPCRICNRRLVDCDMFHDAVCDDGDGMFSAAATNITASVGDEITLNQPHDTIDAHKYTPQSNKNDCELPSSTERLDTDYVWMLQLIFCTLLFGSILALTLIVFPMKESDLMRDHRCDITYHYWCRIQRHVHKIWRFTIISLIVLFIFQSVVTVLNTKPRSAYTPNAVYTLMFLSILIVMFNAITVFVCFHIIYKLRKNRPEVFMRMQTKICQHLTLDKQIKIACKKKETNNDTSGQSESRSWSEWCHASTWGPISFHKKGGGLKHMTSGPVGLCVGDWEIA